MIVLENAHNASGISVNGKSSNTTTVQTEALEYNGLFFDRIKKRRLRWQIGLGYRSLAGITKSSAR